MARKEQGHIPAGSTDGGQWTEKPQTRPEAPLAVNTTEGSFLFPPIDYESVEAYIGYWEAAPVSDRVLSNLVAAYANRRYLFIADSLDEWGVRLGQDPEWSAWQKKQATQLTVNVEFAKRRHAEVTRLAALRPFEIDALAARSIARAAQMYQWSASFSEDEQEEVEQRLVRMHRDEPPMKVVDIWKKYHLKEIVGTAFTDNDITVHQELVGLRKGLNATDTI